VSFGSRELVMACLTIPMSSMMMRPSRQKPLSSQRSYWEVKAPSGSEQIGILQDPDQLDFNQEEVEEQESLEQPISSILLPLNRSAKSEKALRNSLLSLFLKKMMTRNLPLKSATAILFSPSPFALTLSRGEDFEGPGTAQSEFWFQLSLSRSSAEFQWL